MAYPTGYSFGMPTKKKGRIQAPKTGVGLDWGAGLSGWDPSGYYKDPVNSDANYDWTPDPGTGVINPGYGGGAFVTPPAGQGQGQGGRSININGAPDYRGILDKYSSDMRARINTGLANMNVNRIGNARALINRLGVRDPNAALAKFGKYGITLADLQGAADNPFSELKAIEQGAARQRGQGTANFAARGGFRSGGTSRMLENVENERARNEAMASEDALRGLAQGEQEMAGWQQQQEDMLAGNLANYEMQLAQQYQPTTAYWDDSAGGYRWGNKVYDQFGNLVRNL